MTPAALQSKSSTLGPRARGDELGLTAVAFSLFICFHLHLGFAFRPSEHLLAQAVHEVARARTHGSTDSTRTPCTCARTMSRVQQQCPSPWMRHYLVALSPNPPKEGVGSADSWSVQPWSTREFWEENPSPNGWRDQLLTNGQAVGFSGAPSRTRQLTTSSPADFHT